MVYDERMLRTQYNTQEHRLRTLLKRRRKEMGITQSHLSSLMGRARTFVSKYELGERILTFAEVNQLCNLLSLNMVELIDKIQSYDDELLDLDAAEEGDADEPS